MKLVAGNFLIPLFPDRILNTVLFSNACCSDLSTTGSTIGSVGSDSTVTVDVEHSNDLDNNGAEWQKVTPQQAHEVTPQQFSNGYYKSVTRFTHNHVWFSRIVH